MLDFTEPKRYTPQQVLTLFRAILEHLKTVPFAFQAEGVFRVSGDLRHVQQIIANILKGNLFVDHRFAIHDYIGVLKHAVKHSDLLKPDIAALKQFKANVRAKSDNKTKTAVPTLIKALAKSNDEDQHIAAQILYLYGHMLSYAYVFQAKNKMGADNLGIIAGPIFANLIADTPESLLSDTLKLNEICAFLIDKELFQESAPQGVNTMLSRTLALLEDEDLLTFLQKRPIYLNTNWQEMPENPLMPNHPLFEDEDEDKESCSSFDIKNK